MPKANFSLLASPSHVLSKSPLSPLAIAFVSGILMGLATAPLNFFPIAWVALAPLWIMVFSDRNHPHTPHPTPHILALAWGIGYHGFALSWITGLHPLTWLGMSWLASAAVTLFCWVFITLWGAGLVVVWVWLVRSQEPGVRSQEGERGGEDAGTRRHGDDSKLLPHPIPHALHPNSKLKTQNSKHFPFPPYFICYSDLVQFGMALEFRFPLLDFTLLYSESRQFTNSASGAALRSFYGDSSDRCSQWTNRRSLD
jgi:hypothetical protein